QILFKERGKADNVVVLPWNSLQAVIQERQDIPLRLLESLLSCLANAGVLVIAGVSRDLRLEQAVREQLFGGKQGRRTDDQIIVFLPSDHLRKRDVEVFHIARDSLLAQAGFEQAKRQR